MARTRTMTNLIADVRAITDTEAETDRHPIATVERWINEAICALREEVTNAGSHVYLTETSATALASGTADYALPTDFARAYALTLYDSDGDATRLFPIELAEAHDWDDDNTTDSDTPRAYRILGGNIRFYPTPGTGYTYKLLYLPEWTDITTTGTLTTTIPDADRWVVHEAGKRVALKDGDPELYQLLDIEQAKIWTRIRTGAGRRANGPGRRLDTRARRRLAYAAAEWEDD
jgi:hypothetical protein